MDQTSTNGSMQSGQTNPSWAAPMGGNIGEGGFQASAPLPGGGPAPYPPPQQQPQYGQPPQQPPYGQQQQPPPQTVAAPGSYAARSQQAYSQFNSGQPSVSVTPQFQQQQPPPPSQALGAAAGSYAARSAQAYASQPPPPQQPQPTIAQPPPPNAPIPQQPQPPQGGYAARSQQAHANVGATIAAPPPAGFVPQQPQQQPQQPPTQPARTFTSPGPTPPHAPTGGGYAARSAQAHAQQQPPSTVVVSSHTNAYGQTQPPPPPTANGYAPQQPQPPQPPQQQPQQRTMSGDQSVSASTIATHQTGMPATMPTPSVAHSATTFGPSVATGPHAQAVQQRLLTDATRKVQEHAYYMRQAMDQNNLPSVLERAAYMAGELGVPPHGHQHAQASATNAQGQPAAAAPSLSNTGISIKLTPKNYYELYMRALEDMPSFEDYLLGLASNTPQPPAPNTGVMQQPFYANPSVTPDPTPKTPSYTMRELYDCVQYCPRVLSRLYLQISAGSALIRSGEVGPKWVMEDLIQCVKCEQNPIRGLFLRNYLLTVLRDKLPDNSAEKTTPSEGAVGETKQQEEGEPASSSSASANDATAKEMEPGTVKDSYEFVMENFMEMNKLWVRLQHLPGDGNTKEVKKRRERERNDLRILVGTNLVRISQLEGVTSQIYGEAILPRILDHVVTVGDPLSQAYLMDCLVQVFPDEYHIETLPILLNVCPRLRDKVNIRTILQGLMDRLANYLADEELLDESDTNQVKLTLARDSFGMFEECVQKVYNARGPKLTSKEVIRLQTALLQFSLKCYPGNMEQIARCMSACVDALQQANASFEFNNTNDNTVAAMPKALDDVAVAELEKLLSIPLESLALRVLELEKYSALISFLPWANRRAVAKTMLEAVDRAGAPPKNMKEIQQLFSVIEPLITSEHAVSSHVPAPQDPTERATTLMAGLGVEHTPVKTVLEFGDLTNEGSMTPEIEKECALVSKLVHLLHHEDTDVVYEMLTIAREQIRRGSSLRASRAMVAVIFASLKLIRRIEAPPPADATTEPAPEDAAEPAAEEEANGAAKETNAGESSTDSNNDEKESKEEESPEDTQAPGEESKDEGSSQGKEKETEKVEKVEEVSDVATEKKEEEEPTVNGAEETLPPPPSEAPPAPPAEAPPVAPVEPVKKLVSSRQVFIFIQETLLLIGKANKEVAAKLFLEAALTADALATGADAVAYAPVAYELLTQSFSLYEEGITESKAQQRTITAFIGTLLACKSLSNGDYENLITKTAQFSAKLLNKSDQCKMVSQCAHLFFPVGAATSYSNGQRALECLQRSLKVADACTSSNPGQMFLFVDLLEHYVFFLEHKNPSVNAAYVTGLAALVKEYLRNSTDARVVNDARNHYLSLVRKIEMMKLNEETAAQFAGVEADTAGI